MPFRANADKLLSAKKPARATAKKKEDSADTAPNAGTEIAIDDIPIPDEFLDTVQPDRPRKNIDISVD